MVIGWKKITKDGAEKWFYFNKDGVMQTGWQKLTWGGKESWYYFNEDGTMQTGWRQIVYKDKLSWFYFGGGGAMAADECLTIKTEEFCFSKEGVCISGRGC